LQRTADVSCSLKQKTEGIWTVLSGNLTHLNPLNKLRWSNDELLDRYICNRYRNTSSVSDILNIINLPSLAERRLRTRLVMMYKVSFHLVDVPSDILIVSDTRTRKNHPLTYRQIHIYKDT
jgi:hypothetical protein